MLQRIVVKKLDMSYENIFDQHDIMQYLQSQLFAYASKYTKQQNQNYQNRENQVCDMGVATNTITINVRFVLNSMYIFGAVRFVYCWVDDVFVTLVAVLFFTSFYFSPHFFSYVSFYVSDLENFHVLYTASIENSGYRFVWCTLHTAHEMHIFNI